jgi:hypothetical protein
MKTLLCPIVLSLIFAAGCDLAKPQGQKRTPGEQEALSAAASLAEPEVLPVTESEPKAEEEKQPETVRVEAKAGVTGKGQYGQGGGEKPMDIITVPIGQYFQIKERIVFEIQIPEAMKLYKAQHDDQVPATYNDFMRDIIQTNMIKLPELPSSHKYVYDAQNGLGVEHPR